MSRPTDGARRPRGERTTPSRSHRSRSSAPARAARIHRPAPLTARAAILAVALASVLVALAVPFKIWLNQRGDIASLTAQTQRTQHHVSQLQAERQRLHDPSYIESQARKRFHYVMPGQKSYVVLGKAAHPKADHDAAGSPQVSHEAWYSQLWQSMQVAGGQPAGK